MMRLNDSRLATETTLHHIRINRSLGKEIDNPNFLRLFLKHADKLFTNNFAFRLWLCHARKLRIIPLLRIDTDEIEVKVPIRAKDSLNLVPLIFAQKTVVYKDTGKLVSDCTRQQTGRDRRIHTAGQRKQHLAAANPLANPLHSLLHKRIHPPCTRTPANTAHKVVNHFRSLYGMQYLRMELNRIQIFIRVLCRCHRTVCCVRNNLKSRRSL